MYAADQCINMGGVQARRAPAIKGGEGGPVQRTWGLNQNRGADQTDPKQRRGGRTPGAGALRARALVSAGAGGVGAALARGLGVSAPATRGDAKRRGSGARAARL